MAAQQLFIGVLDVGVGGDGVEGLRRAVGATVLRVGVHLHRLESCEGDLVQQALRHADGDAACDGLDGVVDGVIDDPDRCTWDPAGFVGQRVGEEDFSAADAEVVRGEVDAAATGRTSCG